MMAFLLVLMASPLDPMWSLVDEERYDDAIAAALHLAASPEQDAQLRHGAMNLALNAACNGDARRCAEIAMLMVDWSPQWRPDSRALPRLVEAVRAARLQQVGRLNRLHHGQRNGEQFCGPAGTQELLLMSSNAGLSEQRRQRGDCVALPKVGRATVIAYDARLRAIAALGSPSAMVEMRQQAPSSTRPWAVGAAVVGAAAAITVAVILFADAGSGDLAVTVVRP